MLINIFTILLALVRAKEIRAPRVIASTEEWPGWAIATVVIVSALIIAVIGVVIWYCETDKKKKAS
jgi:hypothetical protein